MPLDRAQSCRTSSARGGLARSATSSGRVTRRVSPEVSRKRVTATERVQARADSKLQQHPSGRWTKKKKKKDPFPSATRATRKLLHWFTPSHHMLSRENAIKLSKALGLTKHHLWQLRECFCDIDMDESGTIDVADMCKSIGEAVTPLVVAVFRMLDINSKQRIDFDEFVAFALVYCMYTRDDVLKLCFDHFDADKSGFIDEDEFVALCRAVNNGEPLFEGNFRHALAKVDLNADGIVDFDEFKALDKRMPLILYPAFRLQDNLQKKTLGATTWLRIMENVAYYLRHRGEDGEPPVSKFHIVAHMLLVRIGLDGYDPHPPVDLDYLARFAKVPWSCN